MENTGPEKGTIKELFKTFTAPISGFWQKIVQYFSTSTLILTFKGLADQIDLPKKSNLRDVDYAFATFEFLLIFLFISKLLEIGVDLEDLEEGFRDFFVLILFVLLLILFTGVSRLWAYVFKIGVSHRIIDAFFIYEFNFLFLPSYLIMYPAYLSFADDDDALGGLAMILSLFWLVHLIFYFLKLSRLLQLSKSATVITVIIIPVIGFIFLFFSVFALIGSALPE